MNKTADIELFKDIVSKAWHQNEGPLENIFRIITYAMPFVPGLGWMTFALDKLASLALGLGFEDLGAWFDKKLNLTSGSELNESKFLNLASEFENNKSSTIYTEDGIIKVAFLGSILKSLGIGNIIIKAFGIIKSTIGFLLVTFAASNMDELYKKIEEYAKNKLTETASDVIKKQMFDL